MNELSTLMPRFTPLGSGGTGCAAFGNRMVDSAVDTLDRSERDRPARVPAPPAARATTPAVRKLRRPGRHGGRGGSPDGGPLRARDTGRGWSAPADSGSPADGPGCGDTGSPGPGREGSAGTMKS